MPSGEKQTHPCYGMIELSRFSGGSQEYFGSSIKHSGGMSIRIRRAEVERGLNHDWYFGRKELIEINMSYTQFAELITVGMNTSGVPCTLTTVAGERIERDKFVNKRTQADDEFKQTMQAQARRLDKLTTLLEDLKAKKGTVSKKEIAEASGLANTARQTLASNIPYMSSCWSEQMDKTTLEAKGEIEGFVEHKIRQVGLDGIADIAKVALLDEVTN